MRYDTEHKQKTRERVLKAAGEAIRAEGAHQIGVAGVMAKAGLTHGGFYAHFKSKDELVAAGVEQMFKEGQARLLRDVEGADPREGLARYVDFYLSPGHRDTRTSGCPLPFLSADAPRLPGPARDRFAQGVRTLTAVLAKRLELLGHDDPDLEASSMLAEMVGALGLARGETDPDRSDLILERSRQMVKRRLRLEPVQ